MTDQEIEDYVREYAPEMDPQEVIEFMAEHEKPEDEPDSHVGWATKLLRERGEGQFGDGAPIETVTKAMRQHDERQ
jgi:hypothetical protein